MEKNNEEILTSVKIPKELFKEFKIACVKNKFSITKLNERAMYLYLTDDEFHTKIHNTLDTNLQKPEREI